MQARSGDRLNHDIQILRAFSVLIILAGHNYLRFIYQPLMFSLTYVSTWVGVDVFFAISGYVITISLLKASPIASFGSTKDRLLAIYLFWIRRIFRIWPACWFWAIAVVFFQIIFDANNDPNFRRELVASSWAAILQINNFHQSRFIMTHGHWTHGGIFWSLSLEEQFYIIFPLLFTFLRRNILCTVLLLVAIPQMMFERNDMTNTYLYFFRTDAIIMGVLLAIFTDNVINKNAILVEMRAYIASRQLVRWVFVPFILTSILVLPTGLIEFRYYTGFIAILATVLVFIASADKDAILPIPYIRTILLWVGSRSYSIYLCQLSYVAFMYWCIRGGHNWVSHSILLRTFIACGVFLVAELSYRYIERPCLQIGHRIVNFWKAEIRHDASVSSGQA